MYESYEFLSWLMLPGLLALAWFVSLTVAWSHLRARVGRLEDAREPARSPQRTNAGTEVSLQRATPEMGASQLAEPAGPSIAETVDLQSPESADPRVAGPAHSPVAQPCGPRIAQPADSRSADSTHLRRQSFNWEVFAGGRLLILIGAVLLVIGVGFFMRYAFDQNWINATMRVLGGLALGSALLALGHRSFVRSARTWFANGLLGAGIGVLYLSGFAAFDSYHLVPFPAAYAFMSCVTVGAFLLALRYDSLPISLVAWAGGFVTPFVLSDGTANEIGLASYIVLLDLGIAAVAVVRSRWFALQPLALFGSFFIAMMWYGRYHDQAQWFVSATALVSLWLVFFAAGVTQALRRPKREFDPQHLLGIVNVAFFWATLHNVLFGRQATLEIVTLFVAAAYAAAWLAVKRRAPEAIWLRGQYCLTAGALLVAASALHFHDAALATVLAGEGFAVVALERAMRRGSRHERAPEALAVGCALISFGWAPLLGDDSAFAYAGGAWSFTFGGIDLSLAAIALASLAVARWFSGVESTRWLPYAGRQVAVASIVCITCLHATQFRLVDALALEGLAATFLATRSMLRDLEVDGLVLPAGALLVGVQLPDTWHAYDIFRFVPIQNERFAAFAFVSIALLVAAELYRRRSLLPRAVGRTLRAVGALGVVAGSTVEIRDVFERAIAHVHLVFPQSASVLTHLAQLTNGEQLAISAVWILASFVLIALGIQLRIRDFRLMAIALFDLTILKAFFFDLGNLETLYRVVAFIGLGLVLLAASAIYQRFERGGTSGEAEPPGSAGGADRPGAAGLAGA